MPIQIVRPLESIAETQPQLQPALLRLSLTVSQLREKTRSQKEAGMKAKGSRQAEFYPSVVSPSSLTELDETIDELLNRPCVALPFWR